MDYIFGSNQQSPAKTKPRQIHQSITLKEEPVKTKEITPLQKLKIEQKRKLLMEKIQNEFDQRYDDGEEEYRSGHGTKQLSNDNRNQQYDQYEEENDRLMEPITYEEYQPINPYMNEQLPPSKQLIRTPLKPQKSLSKQVPPKVNKIISSPKPTIKQQNTSKLQSPPKISKQVSSSPKKNQQSPAIKSKEISGNKQISKQTPRIRTKQNVRQSLSSNQAKKISLQKNPSKTKLIGSQKQLSPKKDLKIIKQQFREQTSEPTPLNKLPLKQSKPIQPRPQPKYRGFSKQQKPVNSSLSITQAQEEIRKSIKQMKQSKSKQVGQYNFDNDSFNVPMDIYSLLQGQLGRSQRGLRFIDKKLIRDTIDDVDNLVYNALTSSKPDEYLKGVYQNIEPNNEFIKSEVDDAVNSALDNVNKLIVQESDNKRGLRVNIEKRIAPKHKDDLKQLERLDKYRLIKIKEGEVKNKVGDLRSVLQKEYFNNKNQLSINTSDLVDTDYYAMDHPQTLKAQNLIKQLSQRRKSQHRQYKQILTQKQLQKQRIKQIQKQYESMYNQQRKQKLRQFYQQKHLQRQQQKQQLKQKQQQFKQWIRIYQRQKPLEQKLQQDMVMKFIVPQIQQRHKKMLKIKQEHKPIDIEQINEHDHRYMEYKRDERIRLKAQLESKAEGDHANEDHTNRYYKGKYRYLVLESMYQEKNMTDPKDIQRSKKERQLAYSDQVKYVHKSLIRKKQQQHEDTRALIRRVRNHNGSVDSSIVDNQRLNRTLEVSNGGMSERNPKRDVETIDTYAQGIKNLQYAKSHVREKLMNGQQKKPKIQFIQQKIRQRDYLVQLRQQRQQHSSLPNKQTDRSQSVKNRSTVILGNSRSKVVVNDLSTTNDVQSLKARVDVLDERLKRKEVKLRHARDIQALADTQIQNQYVEAINAKLKLVQELK